MVLHNSSVLRQALTSREKRPRGGARRFASRVAALTLLLGTASAAVSAGGDADAAAYRFNGEGFDSCSQYSAADWNTVFVSGPATLYGLGFYIGGKTADANCFEPSATWVANLNNGWRLAPIWDGLQPPSGCGGSYSNRMSSDPGSSYDQGTNSADNADIVMNRLHLSGVVYLDIESYSATSACKAAVGHYVGGFTNRLHALGYKAGVYGSACSPDMDVYASLNNVPDDAWIAQYNGVDSAASSGSVDCVSSTNWANHHRIHQYRGTHYVTYGGVTVSVDSDCFDGATIGPAVLDLTCG